MYDGLLKQPVRISPLAAERWEVSEDGMVWTIKIRKASLPVALLSWQSCGLVDQLVKDNQLGVLYEANLENIAVLKAIDDYTLELKSKTPMWMALCDTP